MHTQLYYSENMSHKHTHLILTEAIHVHGVFGDLKKIVECSFLQSRARLVLFFAMIIILIIPALMHNNVLFITRI